VLWITCNLHKSLDKIKCICHLNFNRFWQILSCVWNFERLNFLQIKTCYYHTYYYTFKTSTQAWRIYLYSFIVFWKLDITIFLLFFIVITPLKIVIMITFLNVIGMFERNIVPTLKYKRNYNFKQFWSFLS